MWLVVYFCIIKASHHHLPPLLIKDVKNCDHYSRTRQTSCFTDRSESTGCHLQLSSAVGIEIMTAATGRNDVSRRHEATTCRLLVLRAVSCQLVPLNERLSDSRNNIISKSNIMRSLQTMLNELNPFVKVYKKVAAILAEEELKQPQKIDPNIRYQCSFININLWISVGTHQIMR